MPLAPFLAAVARRRRWAMAAHRAWLAWLWLGGAALALIVAGRLLGFGVGWLDAPVLAAPLALAALAGLALGRAPSRGESARLADARLGSDDLLLTASELPPGATGLGAVVLAQAEARIAVADPRTVAPWRPGRRLAWAGGLAALALIAALWLPQLDPFDRVRQARLRQERFAAAERAEVEAERRRAALLAEKPAVEHSADTEGVLDELLQALGEKAPDKAARLAALDRQRRELAAALDRADARALPESVERDLQRVGAADPASVAGLRQALAGGEAERATQAVREAAKAAEKLQGMPPGPERAAAARDLQQKLDDLARAMAGGGAAAQAVQQALDRLAESADPALAKQALEALQAELGVAEAGAQGLAQGARDRQALKQALETLRLAKACAQQGAGEGQPGEGGQPGSLADYQQMFEQLLAGEGGQGQGMGPQAGQGQGGKTQETPEAKTDFTDERSRSQQTAGKIVASWQAPGAQEKGEVVQAYQERLQAARREASDAVAGEDLPPAYREAVKKYFDDLTPAKE